MAEDHTPENAKGGMPEVDFSHFVFMQYQQAKMTLGEIPNPMTGESEVNLPMAQYTIDVMAMLESKTKGNLTEEEEKLIGALLHDLRISFVHKQNEPPAEQAEQKAAEEEEPGGEPSGEESDDSGSPECE